MKEDTHSKYEMVIGLEIHVQLNTRSKAFCADSTQFGQPPNSQVSAISLGHPGTLPRLNQVQIDKAIQLGLALGCEISRTHSFDRKNYFYADLPKGYQLTQDAQPICIGGILPIRVGEETKDLRIHHIHMEEDAGKLVHATDSPHSLVDLNRAGTPLLEIVTEPDLRTAEEVDACMTAMRQLVRWLGVSDGNMEQGSLRCDCNISIRPYGQKAFGQRCEIKNLNSMRFARRAIGYEYERQVELVEAGGTVVQETRQFDPVSGTTRSLRSKEDAQDYRYFPEPDLPAFRVSEDEIARWQAAQPELPWQAYQRLRATHGLSDYDSGLLSVEPRRLAYYDQLVIAGGEPKSAANLLINSLMPIFEIEEKSPKEKAGDPSNWVEMLSLVKAGKVSAAIATQRLVPAILAQPDKSPTTLAEELGLIQSDDEDFLAALVQAALDKYPDKVAAYRKGKKGLIGFFMGEVMRSSKGKAAPKQTKALLEERLG